MTLSVSPISQSGYTGSIYEPIPGAVFDNNDVQKIAPVDAKPNNKLLQDKYTPLNKFSNDDKSNETYNSFGIKTKFSKPTGQNNKFGTITNNASGQEKELTPDEKKTVEVLLKADKMVRAHEQAHRSVGGNLVKGGTSFTYTTGPDGKVYATGGEVQIDISPVKDDPEATIQKMNQVRAAALAPADPSAQDRSVAALAQSIAANARAEAMKKKNEGSDTNESAMNKLIDSYKNNESNKQNSETISKFTGITGAIASLK
ncbi:MAG: hypothetical protein HZB41_04670 [Ignavibacteriae bacterium]|nr:hypothetical protein [Ignavibacteriota bacterium]